MPNDNEFTLRELARLALGVSKMETVNIAVLRGLVEVLLRKLDCTDEKVVITGVAYRNLKILLRDSTPAALTFNDEHVSSIWHQFEYNMPMLEATIKNVESKLETHLEKDFHSGDIKTIVPEVQVQEEADNEREKDKTFCKHCQSSSIEQKLYETGLKSLENAFNRLETRLEELRSNMEELMESVPKNLDTKYSIGKCHKSVTKVKILQRQHEKQFMDTMEEIQRIMNTKVNNLQVTGLKENIVSRFNYLTSHMNVGCQQKPGHALAHIMELPNSAINMKKSKERIRIPMRNEFKCQRCAEEKPPESNLVELTSSIDIEIIRRRSNRSHESTNEQEKL